MSQWDIAFMRHATREKMKTPVVVGNGKMKSPLQQNKPSSSRVGFVPMVTEAICKQLHLFGGVCSDLRGFVLAAGVLRAAGTGGQWDMALEEDV